MVAPFAAYPDLNSAPATAGATGGGDAQRYLALDSLRGLAACWVVVFHMPATGHLWPLPIVQHGYLAVTFFFVLSGFVIGASYGDRLSSGYSIGKFMLLRLGRIYPLHAFMIGVLLAYELIRLALRLPAFRDSMPFTGNTAPNGLFWSLALLQQVPEQLGWNRPSWSIGVEYWTYLVFALLAAAFAARRLLVVALCLILPWVAGLVLGKLTGHSLPSEVISLRDCMFAFGLGLAVFELRRFPRWRATTTRLGLPTATMIELATMTAMLAISHYQGGRLSLLIWPACAAMVGVFAEQRGLVSRLLLTRPMLLLGVLSYSIYMVHQFVQDRLLDVIGAMSGTLPLTPEPTGRIVLSGPAAACDLATLVMLALVIALAAPLYRYVETPARLWSRRVVGRGAAVER